MDTLSCMELQRFHFMQQKNHRFGYYWGPVQILLLQKRKLFGNCMEQSIDLVIISGIIIDKENSWRKHWKAEKATFSHALCSAHQQNQFTFALLILKVSWQHMANIGIWFLPLDHFAFSVFPLLYCLFCKSIGTITEQKLWIPLHKFMPIMSSNCMLSTNR